MTVSNPWFAVTERLLRPARPDLDRSAREAEIHRESLRASLDERALALARCVARIESTRAAVFAADDGAVPRLMTDLEREWLTLSRRDMDGELMGLWARMTPRSWHDRKRWRGTAASLQAEAATALASDVAGVEAAESAVMALRSALAAWGVHVGGRIRWRAFESDAESDSASVTTLLAEPRSAVEAALAGHRAEQAIRSRGERLKREVHELAVARLGGRPRLAEGIAHAALVDSLVRAAPLEGRPNPVTPLSALWVTGYALAEADASGVTIELPRL
jgi:hypothetical protein